MSDEIAHLPAWVRRRDGSPAPFDADRICQSLFAAAESLGTPSALLVRELTDAVLAFLARAPWTAIPSTAEIAEEVEKIVREIGQPLLARRYAELQRERPTLAEPAGQRITIACGDSPAEFVKSCWAAYSMRMLLSRDVAAAVKEGLLHVEGLHSPAGLTAFVLDSPRLAELPWWTALEDWRACGGGRWIVESPEWLCTHQTHPALTPHLCERLLALPIIAERSIELHLNIAEPPSWSPAPQQGPLFWQDEEEATQMERSNFLDGLLERWKALQTPALPELAWHLHARSFQDDTERRQLHALARQALQGKPIRFVFDRPLAPIALAEGLERKCPGVLLQVGLDLPAFAQRPDVGGDGATLLRKLPSLARIAVSAIAQKRQYLRGLPEASALKRRFLIERSAGAVVPLGLDEVVQHLTGAAPADSPLSLDFALRIVQTLRDALQQAGRSINLDVRLDCPALARTNAATNLAQLDTAGKLHTRAGSGTATLLLSDEAPTDADALVELLKRAWESTAVVRLQLEHVGSNLQQGELAI